MGETAMTYKVPKNRYSGTRSKQNASSRLLNVLRYIHMVQRSGNGEATRQGYGNYIMRKRHETIPPHAEYAKDVFAFALATGLIVRDGKIGRSWKYKLTDAGTKLLPSY
jgi:hypothetical protein